MDLVVTCAVGLEDLLRGDLQQEGLSATVDGPGVLRLSAVDDLDAVRRTPMIDRVALAWSPGNDLTEAENLCRAAGFTGDIAFRVDERDPGARGQLIDAVVAQTGWANSTGDWQVNLDPATGRAEIGPLAWAARFGTMQRLPATTPPAVAAGVLRLAKLQPGMNLLDPCGGVGTIPIIDALQRTGDGLVIDLNEESISLAHSNIQQFGVGERVLAEVGDATDLDLADGSVDRIVSDVPFGKRIGSNRDNDALYPGLVREIGRVLAADGRAVIITDDKRRFADAVARDRRLKVVKESGLRYNGVSPTAFTLSRVRTRR
ncbi:methyltransferase domain-containing protein [Yimella sp. cx-573]|nr:methyltransferase domain-containing protein [Yimella sp. cx-573]